VQHDHIALKNFASPSEVGHLIGGKFGFRQVHKMHDLKYDNSVKITLFYSIFSKPNNKNTVYFSSISYPRKKTIITI